jgi:addiction module RelB/DinJ family antitoxin
MTANAVVRARIDEQTKTEAAAVLKAMGLMVSDAFRLMMVRIGREKALPFEPLVQGLRMKIAGAFAGSIRAHRDFNRPKSNPLFKEERHGVCRALVAHFAHPGLFHRTRARAAFRRSASQCPRDSRPPNSATIFAASAAPVR